MIKFKLNGDNTAVITPEVNWLPIDESTPIGAKMLLIDEKQGVALMGLHYQNDGFTHWFPLLTFAKD